MSAEPFRIILRHLRKGVFAVKVIGIPSRLEIFFATSIKDPWGTALCSVKILCGGEWSTHITIGYLSLALASLNKPASAQINRQVSDVDVGLNKCNLVLF